MTSTDGSRLGKELELLAALYPGQVEFNPQNGYLKFLGHTPAVLHLRIPENYPETGVPDVLLTSDWTRNGLEKRMRMAIRELNLDEGVEVLDVIFERFLELLDEIDGETRSQAKVDDWQNEVRDTIEGDRTVIICLHHLLALSKRKLAVSDPAISGLIKRGHSGIMIFSGPAPAVNKHVDVLKAQNWQGFQVRYDWGELWRFGHEGFKEVKTMAEVAEAVEEGDEVDGHKRKLKFLRAAGINLFKSISRYASLQHLGLSKLSFQRS
jgi:hypothetical protein